MTTPALHRIRRQTYELTLPEAEGASRVQERVRSVHGERVLPSLEGVLSTVGAGADTIVLDRIELDLGTLDLQRLEEQLVDRTMEALRGALAERMPALQEAAARNGDGRRIPAHGTDVEILVAFLSTGMMPWWAPEAARESPAELLAGVLERAPELLRRRLRDDPRPVVARRIVKQFPEPGVEALVALLAGPDAADVSESLSDWVHTLEGMGALTGTVGDIGEAVRTRAIEQLLTNQDGAAGLSAALLRWVAGELGVDTHRLLGTLMARMGDGVHQGGALRAWLEQEDEARAGRSDGSGPVASGPAAPPTLDRSPVESTGPRESEPAPPASGALTPEASETPHEAREGSEPGRDGAEADRTDDATPATTPRRPSTRPDGDTALTAGREEPESASDARHDDRRLDTLLDDELGIVIDNAGLVLAWPFLPAFFTELGLLREKKFVTTKARERAVLLLGYLVRGDDTAPEHALVLDKLLCGWPLEEPVDAVIAPSEREQAVVEDLIASMLDSWEGLGGTSVEGFRGAFLQREGVLKHQELGWHLTVSRTAFDVLLDRLPWGIGFVLLPWMNEPVSVQW